MPSINIVAKDNNGVAVNNADVRVDFRSGGPIPWTTGIVNTKTDGNGIAKVSVPALTDHANVVVIKGSYLGKATIPIPFKFLGDLLNPLGTTIVNLVGDAVIPGGVSMGNKDTPVKYDPLGVAKIRTTNAAKDTSDWIKRNLVNIMVILVIAFVVIVLLKYFWKNITGTFRKGRDMIISVKNGKIPNVI